MTQLLKDLAAVLAAVSASCYGLAWFLGRFAVWLEAERFAP